MASCSDRMDSCSNEMYSPALLEVAEEGAPKDEPREAADALCFLGDSSGTWIGGGASAADGIDPVGPKKRLRLMKIKTSRTPRYRFELDVIDRPREGILCLLT